MARLRWLGPARLGRVRPGIAGVVIAAAAISACSTAPGSPAATWGPLAVVGFDTGDEALTHGTLRITDDCAFLEGAGSSAILVWHDQRTTWRPEAREIAFRNHDGRQVTLRDGDQVSLGGGGDSTLEGDKPAAEWIAGIDWVSKPDPSCPLEDRWFINDVVTPG